MLRSVAEKIVRSQLKDWKMMLLKDLKGSIDEIDRFEDEEKGIFWFVVTNNSRTRKSVAREIYLLHRRKQQREELQPNVFPPLISRHNSSLFLEFS